MGSELLTACSAHANKLPWDETLQISQELMKYNHKYCTYLVQSLF